MLRIAAAMLVLFTAACGGDDVSTPVDAAAPDPDAEIVPPDATAGCNAIANTGDLIDQLQVAEDLPAPLGGALPDGDYHLTGWRIYTGPGGATGPTGAQLSETSTLIAGVSQVVLEAPLAGLAPTTQRVYQTYTLVADGTALALTETCPGSNLTGYDAFTETTDGLIFYDTANHEAIEYTRY
jgi:hypothetical protein